MVELSLAPRTHVREDSERSEPRRQFLASEASHSQTVFGERSEFWEKKFDERSERLAVFFFSSELRGILLRNVRNFFPGWGWGIVSRLSREKTIRNAKELCLYPKIFPLRSNC
jgi:hypothetical protein